MGNSSLRGATIAQKLRLEALKNNGELGYFGTKFLRFPRLATQIRDICSVNTRKCPLTPVNAR